MKEMIKFYYNIKVEQYEEQNEVFQFKSDDLDFVLIPFRRSREELKDIYQICVELKELGIPVHTFIQNKSNELITTIYEKEYILLKLEEPKDKEYNIIDILQLMDTLHLSKNKSLLYRNQWGELWSKKIDYFEYQIHELGKDKKIILNSFTYYIGLAENAIAYVNSTLEQYKATNIDRITLCHKRLKFPNMGCDYLNPLSFIFDLEIRDIAEYIKSVFFKNQQDAWVEFKTFLNLKHLSMFSYQLFYARLLYPSYYFDLYDEIMNKEKQEDSLLIYIKQSKEYEAFLKKVYIEISKLASIESVEWIIKEH